MSRLVLPMVAALVAVAATSACFGGGTDFGDTHPVTVHGAYVAFTLDQPLDPAYPTLVLHGDKDLVPRSDLAKIARSLSPPPTE